MATAASEHGGGGACGASGRAGGREQGQRAGAQFTRFTGSKVQILTQLEEVLGSAAGQQAGRGGARSSQRRAARREAPGTQFASFTGTKAQLTQLVEVAGVFAGSGC